MIFLALPSASADPELRLDFLVPSFCGGSHSFPLELGDSFLHSKRNHRKLSCGRVSLFFPMTFPSFQTHPSIFALSCLFALTYVLTPFSRRFSPLTQHIASFIGPIPMVPTYIYSHSHVKDIRYEEVPILLYRNGSDAISWWSTRYVMFFLPQI